MLVFDGTENPVGLLTNSATVSFAYKYDPWGVQTLTAGGTGNGAGQNPYAFHAEIKDPAPDWSNSGNAGTTPPPEPGPNKTPSTTPSTPQTPTGTPTPATTPSTQMISRAQVPVE